MKKIRSLLCLLLLLSSCSTEDAQRNEITSSQESQEEIYKIPEQIEETQTEDAFEEILIKTVDFSEYFKGIDGAAVFYTPEEGEYYFNFEKVNTSFSPYSTFKIMSTLIALHEGIVTSAESEMSYNGRNYWNDNWNRQLNLKESFQVSCVWFYHQMIYGIPASQVEKHLIDMNYGNCDLSEWHGNGSNSVEELNGFWLNSSLRISPKEQVYFLEQLFEKETLYEENHLLLLKEFMETEDPQV